MQERSPVAAAAAGWADYEFSQMLPALGFVKIWPNAVTDPSSAITCAFCSEYPMVSGRATVRRSRACAADFAFLTDFGKPEHSMKP